MKPRVAVIGSCRVFSPVELLQQDGKIESRLSGIDWYTHSTFDVLQKIQIVRKVIEVPGDIVPLLVHVGRGYDERKFYSGAYKDADVVIVEISSIKVLRYGTWYLQQWCVRDVLENEASDFPNKVLILEQLIRDKQDALDVMIGLKMICASLGVPVIFVPHFDVPTEDGRRLPERSLIRSSISQFCRERNLTYFDPTEIIEDHGYKESIIDTGHYRVEFERTIADGIYKSICETLNI